jgi:hypothetical protein
VKLLILSILVVLLNLGCTPVTTITRLSESYYPGKPEGCDIKILTQAPTNRKYDEIAILNTVAMDGTGDLNTLLPSIMATACRLGADAILIKNVSPADGTSPGKAFTVAIKYLD